MAAVYRARISPCELNLAFPSWGEGRSLEAFNCPIYSAQNMKKYSFEYRAAPDKCTSLVVVLSFLAQKVDFTWR